MSRMEQNDRLIVLIEICSLKNYRGRPIASLRELIFCRSILDEVKLIALRRWSRFLIPTKLYHYKLHKVQIESWIHQSLEKNYQNN